jgi:hypothetical protein
MPAHMPVALSITWLPGQSSSVFGFAGWAGAGAFGVGATGGDPASTSIRTLYARCNHFWTIAWLTHA